MNKNNIYKVKSNKNIDFSKIPNDFKWKNYIKLNVDLNHIDNKIDSCLHYLTYGIKEERIYKIDNSKIPNDFDWKIYIKLNPDLNHIHNKKDALMHYLIYGIREQRIYKIDNSKIPNDFDYKLYIQLNDDLNIQDEMLAKAHYLKYGIYENRNFVSNPIINSFTNYNKYYDFINENEILYTKMFHKQNPLFLKYSIDINILNNFHDLILIIDFNNGGGGTTFFLNTIVSKYKNYATFLIIRYEKNIGYTVNINEEYLINTKLVILNDIISFIDKRKNQISKIFVNSFVDHDINFIHYIMNLNIFKIGITHDYFNIYTNPQPTFKQLSDSKINANEINIIKYDELITQNIANLNTFVNYYKKSISLVELPDYFKNDQLMTNNNNKIHCCIIGNINQIKGADELVEIVNYFEKENPNIEFYIIGHISQLYLNKCINIKCKHYNSISEFNSLLIEFKPNLIIELTSWPETYSYTLTLSMLTDLPIIYLNKPCNSVVKDRLKTYKKSFEFKSIDELKELIILHHQNFFYTIYPVIGFNKYWNDLFIGDKIKKSQHYLKCDFKYNIKPYFIYFPQFHDISENNINFYQGYNDIKNLQIFNENEIIKKPIPLEEYCNIDKYDYIKNTSLLQKQIDLISEYGFSGLAVYYYWFSKNNISNKNMIMNSVIDKFFDSTLNMHNRKIFFIWANENWSDNAAFSQKKDVIIENIYDKDSYIKNVRNLINYFKKNNYLKIENKPVFFIYHNYLINNIEEFYSVLNAECIKNGFDGVNLVLNSFNGVNNNFKNFYINFNYKKYDSRFFDSVSKKIKLDYKKYIDDPYHITNNKIQTIVYDFDNRPRLYKPSKLNMSTTCINNTEMHKIILSKKLLEKYNNGNYGELDKILLVNALNEWGENMVFEPSDKYGYYNINLLKQTLCT